MTSDRDWHEMTRGMKKAQVRALWEPPPMSDEETRKALHGFAAEVREIGLTGVGSPAEVYRDQRLHHELMRDDKPTGEASSGN